jgi:uridine phosphorylase
MDEGKLEKVQDLLLPSPSVYPNEAYRLGHEGKAILVVHPGIGAALAAGTFDELIALGCRKFVACGSAGVLRTELKRDTLVIPSSAVRDEGTSFHYCPPSRDIAMDRGVIQKLEAVLKKQNINYYIGKTWTTDGFYRETKGKVANRCAEGCLTVDMECSALLAVAGFRNVTFGQYFAVADDVSGDEWDPRDADERLSFHERLFWLSVEACLSL